MRIAASAGLCLCVVLTAACVARATCDPTTDPDKTDIASARAAVAANCDCAGATSHGAYVSCAVQQANLALVNKSCAGAVKRCAAHSTCGKPPAAVTCCVTGTTGTKCKVKRDAAHCAAPRGGAACVGNYRSCCDSCSPGGCATTTTTSTTSPATTFCNWTCSSGVAGCVDASSTCTDYCDVACGDYCHSINDYCAVAACEPACEDNLCNVRCSDGSRLCFRLSNCTDSACSTGCDSFCRAIRPGGTCAIQAYCDAGCNP